MNVITLYYTKDAYYYTVKYLEQGTNIALHEQKNGSGSFDAQITENAVDVPGYRVVGNAGQSITLDADGKELTFWYTKRNDLSLTVYYKDKDDQSEIHASNTLTNMTLGTVVSIEELVVDIAGYQYAYADPAAVTVAPDNNVLTLYYEKKDIDYTVRYFYDEVEDTALSVTNQAKYKSEVTTYTEKPKEGYALDRVENLSLVIDANSDRNIINVYYAPDVLRDGDETDDPDDSDSETGGDGITDKYQAVVHYTIENGVWSDNSSSKITHIFTLKTYNPTTGIWNATNAALGNTIPVGMVPVTGYDASSGTWTPQPDKDAVITGNAGYHYHYGDKTKITIQIEVVNGTSYPAPSVTVFEYDETARHIQFTPDDGHILESVTVNGVGGQLTDGKCAYSHKEDLHIKVVYTEDTFGGGDDGEQPDNIPDKYQKKIVFKVVNGTWADGTAEDRLAIVTLKKNGAWSTEGEAVVDVPTGMKANENFKSGAWDAAYLNGEGVTTLTVKGSDPAEQVFTHTFQRSMVDFDAMAAYQVVHWLQQTDGTYVEADREFPLYAKVGTEVTAAAKDYGAHYALKGELPKGIVTDPRPQTPGAEPNLLTLNVYYDLDRHTVKYNLNGGTGAAGVDYGTKTYICGTGEQVKAVPMNHGYIFKGWQDQDGNLYEADTDFVVDQDYVFTAVWMEFNLPKTGDTANLILWIGMMAGSSLLLAILFKRKHTRKA